MPKTWNGTGTAYLSAKDRYPDGSFITTEWIVFFTFPIFPIGSTRVILLEKSHGWMRTSKRYILVKKVPLDLYQVLMTYFFSIGSILIGAWFFTTIIFSYAYTTWGPIVASIGFFIPYYLVIIFFFRAQ